MQPIERCRGRRKHIITHNILCYRYAFIKGWHNHFYLYGDIISLLLLYKKGVLRIYKPTTTSTENDFPFLSYYYRVFLFLLLLTIIRDDIFFTNVSNDYYYHYCHIYYNWIFVFEPPHCLVRLCV